TPQSPILNDEDERFLERITSEGTPPPLPVRPGEASPPPLPQRPTAPLDNVGESKGKDAQTALMDGAERVPLPGSPPTDAKQKTNYWGFLTDIPKRAKVLSYEGPPRGSDRGTQSQRKVQAASDLQAAVDDMRNGKGVELNEDGTINEGEKQQEEQDLTEVLDQLNLSAVNNRVFSFSKESQELLEKFKLVLKDLINGVPTAYDDLEKLLTNSENQLNKMFGSMPPFLQTLVRQLPAKMTAALGPEILAAAAEKPGVETSGGLKPETAQARTKSKKSRIPSLKKLVSIDGGVAAMLRSILNFLKLRFPAVMTGTNVLMSLAVFVLLFVFWYCHKRGKETRLEKEASARASESDLEKSASDVEDSVILEPGPPRDAAQEVESPIHIHATPAIGDKPSASVYDMPSVLDLPEPA
ncbi:hypothetical protein K490DRAFT_11261, partial [Saccharata proteae CBS 121410]